jgi:hypothetical protein
MNSVRMQAQKYDNLQPGGRDGFPGASGRLDRYIRNVGFGRSSGGKGNCKGEKCKPVAPLLEVHRTLQLLQRIAGQSVTIVTFIPRSSAHPRPARPWWDFTSA